MVLQSYLPERSLEEGAQDAVQGAEGVVSEDIECGGPCGEGQLLVLREGQSAQCMHEMQGGQVLQRGVLAGGLGKAQNEVPDDRREQRPFFPG